MVLFMKGTPDAPQCGFSRAVVQLLGIHGVPPEKLQTYDVLADGELRADIKEFRYVADFAVVTSDTLTYKLSVIGPRYPSFM